RSLSGLHVLEILKRVEYLIGHIFFRNDGAELLPQVVFDGARILGIELAPRGQDILQDALHQFVRVRDSLKTSRARPFEIIKVPASAASQAECLDRDVTHLDKG